MDYERYQKQIILPNFGENCQHKLNNSSIIIIGIGGIGCPTLMYLSSMGIGTIGILDYDRVDISNLHRQLIYTEESIGKSKTLSAKEFCEKRNSNINIIEYDIKLTNDNTLEILKNYEIIIDCTDNIFTRQLINDACVILNKPYFFGSSIGTSGQVGIFNYNNTSPCLRCLYSNKINETCESTGVLGVIPGIIGNLLCLEVIKYICKYESKLTNKLLNYDIIQGFYSVTVPKNPKCLVCSPDAIINIDNYSKLNIYSPKCSVKFNYSTNIKENVIYLNNIDSLENLFEKYNFEINDLIFNCENKIKSKLLVNKLRQSGKSNVWYLI